MYRVDIPKYKNIPRWLVLTGEIDSRDYLLREMLNEDKKKLPIEKMVDKATGYDLELLKQAKILIGEIEWLKTEYDKEVGDA